MEYLLIISVLVSFLLTLIMMPRWIKKCKQIGLLWENMNKYGHPKNVAASGGIIVIMSFVFGVLFYIALRTLILKDPSIIIASLSLLAVILLMTIISLTDDFLGWKRGGLSWKFRIFLALFASIPLIVINAGTHVIYLPFLGDVNLGLIYTLILIPLGIAGATTTYNFLAGFNGLEAGQGIIILSFLSFIAYITGNPWLSVIGLCMVASLLGFYIYNKYPAKVFAGNTLTWAVGALIACMAILGNFEKIALFIFIPYILEMILKVFRGRFKKYSFGIPDKDDNLSMPYDKIYGLTHLSILIISKFKKEVKEKDVVYMIFGFQIFLCLIPLLLFKNFLWG